MSRVEREEGPRFGPLRPGRQVAVRSEQAGPGASGSPGRGDPPPSFGPNPGPVAAWLAAGIASISAAALLLVIWAGAPEGGTQGWDSLIVAAAWVAVMVFVVARDHGRALRVFNLLALLCALMFVAIVVLVIIQFLRLAGEA